MKAINLEAAGLTELENPAGIYGGMQWIGGRESTNVEIQQPFPYGTIYSYTQVPGWSVTGGRGL